jgi:predicted metal-dependent hydrolase
LGRSAITRSGNPADPGGPCLTNIVFTRHPRARRYVIRVSADGVVRVTIPRWGTKRDAAAFAERERSWIEKQLRRNEELRAEDGEQLGTSDPDPRTPNPVALARARRELPARVFELAGRHALTVARVSIRNQRSRWGSCSRSGHICLNWRLIDMPEWVRDYVIIHELMHLKRMDHSPRFWKLVEQACPGYDAARRWLREHARGAASKPPAATAPSTREAQPPQFTFYRLF